MFDSLFGGEFVVGERIILVDVDRPGEALEVEVISSDEAALKLAAPNTNVQFRLLRRARDAPYEGSLGGRNFCFVPPRAGAGKAVALTGRK